VYDYSAVGFRRRGAVREAVRVDLRAVGGGGLEGGGVGEGGTEGADAACGV
jgi:hypothetical protein